MPDYVTEADIAVLKRRASSAAAADPIVEQAYRTRRATLALEAIVRDLLDQKSESELVEIARYVGVTFSELVGLRSGESGDVPPIALIASIAAALGYRLELRCVRDSNRDATVARFQGRTIEFAASTPTRTI